MSSPFDGADMGDLFAQMNRIQEQLAGAEESAAAEVVEGSAAGGAVRVSVSGEFSFSAVHIDPAVVDPADIELLEDLVLAAVRDAAAKLVEVRREAMGAAVSDALGGLFGFADDAGVEPGELPE